MTDYDDQALAMALLFHETYERLAPNYGYKTQIATRTFDPDSPNGQLMIAVCSEVTAALREQVADLRFQWQAEQHVVEVTKAENAALRKDAERYRWVNSQHGFVTHADPDINNDYVDAAIAGDKA